MTKILTASEAEQFIARQWALIEVGDKEGLHDWFVEVGQYAGTGTPQTQYIADRLEGDYICALDDGRILAWGQYINPDERELMIVRG